MKRFALISLLVAFGACAQTTYRWIDPKTGRTNISDAPPPAGISYKKEGSPLPEDQSPPQELSYATRQAAEKFPVIVYLAPECDSICERASELLKQRRIPYEKVVFQSNEEASALREELGDKFLIPSIRVGRKLFGGFSAAEWNNLLDLAGYPKTATP